MKIWLDAHFSPALAAWMERRFELEEAWPIQTDSELLGLKDRDIFERARLVGAVVMTKDQDFVDLVERLGPPPQVLWVTCGNTSNLANDLGRCLPCGTGASSGRGSAGRGERTIVSGCAPRD